MIIKITKLEKLITKVLSTTYSEEEANLIKDVVLFGELSGRPSHGILRLLKENYGVFTDTIQGKPEYMRKTKVSTLIDGKGNVGMLVGSLAMQEVIKLGKENGIGIVGTKGSINTTGSLSYYCEKIAKENLIGVIFTHASPMMAPFSSKKALFGTNPIAFGIPSEPHPILFDMATAATTFGTLAKLKAEGKKLPEGVAIDADGNITTDAAKAMNGAMLAFDNSYKGSGLAMMVEILAAVWTGASFAGVHTEDGWGNVYMAFSPDLLSDVNTFKEKTQQLVTVLKETPTRDNRSLRLPGEHTIQTRDANLTNGEIEISDTIYKQIQKSL